MELKKCVTVDETNNPLDEALSLINYGMELTFQGKFQEAEENANIAMRLAEKHNNHIIKIDALNLLGINTINQGFIEQSKDYFQQALNTALKENLTKIYTNC
ncbi:MAG TPA: tetratricopeptide repeat protein [Candidatus Cloacimonadota bacterium]|nr:tetratricopeptide repeat protein [Candidatus Cloacimonadota bacterium]